MGWTVYNSNGNILESIALTDNSVSTAKILEDNVTSAKILADNVTNAKLANMVTRTIKGNATSGTANPTDIAMADGDFLIANGSALVTVPITGDVVIDNAGAAVIQTGAVDAAMFAAATLATVGETNTGTNETKIITPNILAGSNYGERVVQLVVVDFTADVAVATTGKFWFVVPSTLHGMELVEVSMNVITAGVTGNTDVMIYNLTDTADMLSAAMRIENGETSTSSSLQPGSINTNTTKDVVLNDVLRIDIDTIQTGTAPKGLIVTMIFRIP